MILQVLWPEEFLPDPLVLILQGVFRRAGARGLIYDFLLLSCGIRLLMFQPCFDWILICLIRSLIYYTVLHSAQGLMLILRAILYSTSFQFGGPASRLNSGGWIGGISCGITICSCLFVSWWTFSRCSSSSCFGIFRILLFSLAKRSLMNLKEFLLNRVLVCSFFLQSFLKFSALLKDSRFYSSHTKLYRI